MEDCNRVAGWGMVGYWKEGSLCRRAAKEIYKWISKTIFDSYFSFIFHPVTPIRKAVLLIKLLLLRSATRSSLSLND